LGAEVSLDGFRGIIELWGLLFYTSNALCIRQLWRSSIINFNDISIAHYQYTDIYPLFFHINIHAGATPAMLSESTGPSPSDNASIRANIEHVRWELEKLKLAGQGGAYPNGAVPSEITTHSNNIQQWDEIKKNLAQAKVNLAEARGASLKADVIKKNEERVNKLQFSSDNLRDIIMRQESIKGFYTPPSNLFKSKQADLRQLQHDLEFI